MYKYSVYAYQKEYYNTRDVRVRPSEKSKHEMTCTTYLIHSITEENIHCYLISITAGHSIPVYYIISILPVIITLPLTFPVYFKRNCQKILKNGFDSPPSQTYWDQQTKVNTSKHGYVTSNTLLFRDVSVDENDWRNYGSKNQRMSEASTNYSSFLHTLPDRLCSLCRYSCNASLLEDSSGNYLSGFLVPSLYIR